MNEFYDWKWMGEGLEPGVFGASPHRISVVLHVFHFHIGFAFQTGSPRPSFIHSPWYQNYTGCSQIQLGT